MARPNPISYTYLLIFTLHSRYLLYICCVSYPFGIFGWGQALAQAYMCSGRFRIFSTFVYFFTFRPFPPGSPRPAARPGPGPGPKLICAAGGCVFFHFRVFFHFSALHAGIPAPCRPAGARPWPEAYMCSGRFRIFPLSRFSTFGQELKNELKYDLFSLHPCVLSRKQGWKTLSRKNLLNKFL